MADELYFPENRSFWYRPLQNRSFSVHSDGTNQKDSEWSKNKTRKSRSQGHRQWFQTSCSGQGYLRVQGHLETYVSLTRNNLGKAQLMYSSRKHACELVDLNTLEIVFNHQACFNKLKFQTGSFDFHDPQVTVTWQRAYWVLNLSEITKWNFAAVVEGTLKGDGLEMGNYRRACWRTGQTSYQLWIWNAWNGQKLYFRDDFDFLFSILKS